ncbi:endonuclease/exonuclease/phosphatase family protein [Aminobacter aganoensis]|uniref:Endonuclease/exonuclease/phosphatase family metal-dependent hydrolase n=1 Tax=Aminobacter aganoensis TaxID=83264 RepID=A0A7X0FAA6_9HYPH|nr:endonuclease/exonuclease/phosphatase family protein [Aminobacter aganoensis]MBB6356027.1 endonuclease/exonuclease/phosphatase family metal-dependent hydrolase [Aminobacter aganoensis]
MKLVTYNTQYGVGRDGRYDLGRIAAAIEGADIIALQEVTRNFMRNNMADMVEGLARLLPDYFHVYGVAMDIDFGTVGDDGKPANKRLQFGNMVLSRWPIVASRNLLLPRSRRLSRGNLQRSALEALVMAPSGALRVYSVHLDHVNLEERIAQIRHLKERVYAYPMEGGAISGAVEYGFPELPSPEEFVLMGDFNMVPGSPEHLVMAGAPDPVEGAQIVAHHPVDAYALAGGVPDGSVSWTDATHPEKSRLIDYAFVQAGLAASVRSIRIDKDAQGSDHQPVWLELA